jgi:hypothetical protein
MSTVEIQDLNENVDPQDAEVLPVVNSPGSAPNVQKLRLDTLFAKFLDDLGLSADAPVLYDPNTRTFSLDPEALDAKLDLAGGTMEGAVDFDLNNLIKPRIDEYEEGRFTLTTSTPVINALRGGVHIINYSGAVTISFTGSVGSSSVGSTTLRFMSNVTSVTWPSGVNFPDGEPPEIEGQTWMAVVLIGSTVFVFPIATNVST